MIPSCTASTTDSSELVSSRDYLLPNVTGDGTLHLCTTKSMVLLVVDNMESLGL